MITLQTEKTYATKAPFSLLLIGEPFSGKTTLAGFFPNPGFIDADAKATNAIENHRRLNPDYAFRSILIDVDDTGREIEPQLRWLRFLEACDAMIKDPWVKTVIADSGTKIAQYLCDYLLSQPSAEKSLVIGGSKVMTQHLWYPFAVLFQRLLAKLCSCGKNFIMPVHIRTDKDEVSGSLVYKPSIPGQTGEAMGKLFQNFWLCKTKLCPPDKAHPRGVSYIVRTAPDARLSIGTALPDLPAEFESETGEVKRLLKF